MPQQLIYTSAPRGIVAGRSGYCTVARSALMREPVMLQLEKFCYYQHLSLSGGRERPIFACRIVDIRGTRFHVLSRLQDAGLDFTGRTNFIAHHLVFTPEEIRQYPTPPVILGHWSGWRAAWTHEPQLLENETWAELAALNGKATNPALTWQQVTGEAANGYGMLEARAGAAFHVDDQSDATALDLFAESLALLEIRDPRRDSRVAAWSYTFTTSMQEQDNPADFRWRCLHADNPGAGRFVTPDARSLSAVRTLKCTTEEAAFARNGRTEPCFMIEPQDLKIVAGLAAHFSARAEGVPSPEYQWFQVDRAEKRQPLAGETNPDLVIKNPPLGVSRYVVRVSNSLGDVASRVAKLSVDDGAGVSPPSAVNHPRTFKTAIPQKSEGDIERQRQQIARTEDANSQNHSRNIWGMLGVALLTTMVMTGLTVFGWIKYMRPVPAASPAPKTNVTAQGSAPGNGPASPHPATAKTAEPLVFSREPRPVAAPWQASSIGNLPATPTSKYSQGAFFFNAPTGDFLPQKTNDDISFTSRPEGGPAQFMARSLLAGTLGKTICGIMLRESGTADAPFVFIGTAETNIIWMQRLASGNPSSQAILGTTGKPLYLNLVYRKPNLFGSFSNDRTNWLSAGPQVQIDFASPKYLMGFAVCSEGNERALHPVFDHVTVNGIPQ